MQKFPVSTRLLLGAGMAAALCWTAADVLLVGFVQPPQPETLFAPALAAGLGDDADMAALMLTASPQRLLWGVLPATFSAVLYLVSVFGVWRLMQPSRAARFCCALLFAGYALSPLGHAGFYFVGAAAQALQQSTADGALLLSLFQQFIQMLEIHWLSSVGLLALGWLLFAVQTLRGQTVLPRKSAGCNPLPVGIFIALGCSLFPRAEWAAMMGGATLNLAQLVFFVSAYRAVGNRYSGLK